MSYEVRCALCLELTKGGRHRNSDCDFSWSYAGYHYLRIDTHKYRLPIRLNYNKGNSGSMYKLFDMYGTFIFSPDSVEALIYGVQTTYIQIERMKNHLENLQKPYIL